MANVARQTGGGAPPLTTHLPRALTAIRRSHHRWPPSQGRHALDAHHLPRFVTSAHRAEDEWSWRSKAPRLDDERLHVARSDLLPSLRHEARVPGSRSALMAPSTRTRKAAPELFLNRELSGLEFHARVLEEAGDSTNPLLERLRFATIVASNLDEFFMVRVAAVKNRIQGGDRRPTPTA